MEMHNTICHFCSMQDKLHLGFSDVFDSVHFGRDSFVREHHDSDGGGLCPRGNFCVELAQHKLRTSYARIDGEQVRTSRALQEIAFRVSNAESSKMAILLSGSLPLEDTYLAAKLGKQYGSKWVAQISPEDLTASKFLNRFSFAELPQQQIVLAIGDIFSLHPTISKRVHDARFFERGNFFAVIDNNRSRTSRFARSFLRAAPGKVADIIEALAHAVSGEQYSLEETGVDEAEFEQLATTLKSAGWCTVIFAPGIGHFSDPIRIAFWAKKLAKARHFGFAAMGTGCNGRGSARLLSALGFPGTNAVLDAIGRDEIQSLLCLGCDPIEAFPFLYEHIKRIPFAAATTILPTAIYKIADITIPAHCLFERKGTFLNLEEKPISLDDVLPAPEYPGEQAVLSELLKKAGADDAVSMSDIQREMDNFDYLIDAPEPKHTLDTGEIYAVGYHLPHHHGDGSLTRLATWAIRHTQQTDNSAIISPAVAEKLDISNGASIVVKTKVGKSEFVASIGKDQFDDVVLVPAYMPNGRAILDWCPDTGFIPAAANVEKT